MSESLYGALVGISLLLAFRLRDTGSARAVLVLTPWTIRNFAAFDHFVPISTDSGATLVGANCFGTYVGANIGGWSLGCVRHDYSGNEAVPTSKQEDDGIRYALHNKGRWPKVAVARLLRRPWQANPGRATLGCRVPGRRVLRS